MPTKIKTIKRRKSWPRWARWYAVGPYDRAVYSLKPEWGEMCGGLSGWMFAGKGAGVRGPNIKPNALSLRRIID